MISLKKGHEIHLTNNHLIPHDGLRQQMAVQDVLMQNNSAYRLSQSDGSWRVTIQDMTVKRISTNPMDTFISSQKAKSLVPPKPWDRPRRAGYIFHRKEFSMSTSNIWFVAGLSSALALSSAAPLAAWAQSSSCPPNRLGHSSSSSSSSPPSPTSPPPFSHFVSSSQHLFEKWHHVVVILQITELLPNVVILHTMSEDMFLLLPFSTETEPASSFEPLVPRVISGQR